MTIAAALLVGLDQVNPQYYGSNLASGTASSSANAARIQAILPGYRCISLLNQQATSSAILAGLQLAPQLQAGDIFVFYFAGHGLDGPPALAAWDQPLTAREIDAVLVQCKPGVRLVAIVDACDASSLDLGPQILRAAALGWLPSQLNRLSRWAFALAGAPPPLPDMQAQLLFFSATQRPVATVGGALSQALLTVWNRGFTGSYRSLFTEIYATMKASAASPQLPKLILDGPVTAAFEDQQPFTIAPPAAGGPIVSGGMAA